MIEFFIFEDGKKVYAKKFMQKSKKTDTIIVI